jgi:hypothetical protein
MCFFDTPKITESVKHRRNTEDLQRMPALHSSYAKILLSFHNWDVKKALVAFYENPFDALKEARNILFQERQTQNRGVIDPDHVLDLL